MKTIKKTLSTGVSTTHKQEGRVNIFSPYINEVYNKPLKEISK